MAYVLTFTNQKGGVGKTTSVSNTAAALVRAGLRVCMIDADPQGNLTQANDGSGGPLLEQLLLADTPPGPDIAAPVASGAALIATSAGLATITEPYRAHPAYADGLGRVIGPIEDRYDVILIDTPPGINQWSGLALLAADGVVIPARPSDLDVTMAAETWDFVEDHVRASNPTVAVLGVLLTQTQRHRRMLREAREGFEHQEMHVFDTWIPGQESVLSAARHGTPTIVREPQSRAGIAYAEFADELLSAMQRHAAVA